MHGSELLSTAHAVEVILMLGESNCKMSDFLKVTSNFYTIEKLLAKLEDCGVVRTIDVDRTRGTWFALTPTGKIVAEHLKIACDTINAGSDPST